jgi:hypothetical protein
VEGGISTRILLTALTATILGLLLGLGSTSLMAQSQPPKLPLDLLPDTLAVCRLDAGAPLPPWAGGSTRFLTLSRTAEELSMTAVESSVPPDVRCERGYRAFRVRGPCRSI